MPPTVNPAAALPQEQAVSDQRHHSLSEESSSSASDAGEQSGSAVLETPTQEDAPPLVAGDGVEEQPGAPSRKCDETISSERLAELRVSILCELFAKLEDVEALGGERSIPFFQVGCSLFCST